MESAAFSGLEVQISWEQVRGGPESLLGVCWGKELFSQSFVGKRMIQLGAQEAMAQKGDWSSEDSQGTGKQEEGGHGQEH